MLWLSKALSTSAELWLILQNDFVGRAAKNRIWKELDGNSPEAA